MRLVPDNLKLKYVYGYWTVDLVCNYNFIHMSYPFKLIYS